ncbi:riboflavin transporter MCH5 [Physcia stellaris]|nr:riboflavin transporter MCH5 [Physcia stellaris]
MSLPIPYLRAAAAATDENCEKEKHLGHHVLDQTFSAHPRGQSESKAEISKQIIGDDQNEGTDTGLAPVPSLAHTLHPTNIDAEKCSEKRSRAVSAHNSITDTAAHCTQQYPTIEGENDAKSYPEGGLRAWLVVVGSFSGMVASFGIMNTMGTFQTYLTTHQLASYSPSAVGWIFSLYVFLSFFCGVQIGPIFDAKGPQWIVAAGTGCLLAGIVGVAFSTEFWHFIITFSILCGLGTSLIFTPAVASIAHFFLIRRANATGIAATGGSVGGIIFPLMLQSLFPRIGFRYSTLIMALLIFFLLLLANVLIRDKIFTLTTMGVFFLEWGLFVPLSFISSYALRNGIDPSLSYQLLAVVNAGSVFGRWLPGYVADKLGRFNTMIITLAMCLICVLGLWLTAGGSLTRLCVFAVGFGFASGSNISLTPVCVGQLCDTEVFGRWYATCYTIVSFGCLTGIPIAGKILEYNHGDYWGLTVFTGLCYVAALACFIAARVGKVGWDPRKIY